MKSVPEWKSKQIALFDKELKRQQEAVGRIEKIKVQYRGTPEDVLLSMNKGVSTPFHCAQHMSEMLTKRSALAMVDGTELWDMHRPLEKDCEIQLLHFQDPDPFQVNRAFWRTCSLLLGGVISNAFKEDIQVNLHSFPSPNVRSGSFVYDVQIPELTDWKPTQDELRILSADMVIMSRKDLPLQRLAVKEDVAQELFSHNKFKLEQIPSILEQAPDKRVIVYRVGDHMDISRGPMVGSTQFIGRCTVASVHQIENDNLHLYRFQGVALPKGIFLNHFAYGVLEDRARRLNSSLYSGQILTETFKPNLEEKAAN